MSHSQNVQPVETGTVATPLAPPQAPHPRWSRFIHGEWAVTFFVLTLYGIFLIRLLGFGGDPRDFIMIGSKFIYRPGPSAVIKPDPGYHYSLTGYDGQFCYYIALDPTNARYYIDDPAYRFTHILYPITARIIALGQPGLIPYTLILLNWLAIGGGTLALAAWLRRKGCSPWFALVYAFYPGQYIALQRDLNEPLAYALVALAIYLFDFGGRHRVMWAGISFALAALAREIVLLFAIIYGLALLFDSAGTQSWRERIENHWRRAALLLGLVLGPLALYKGFLLLWLHSAGLPSDNTPEVVPFRGIFALWPWEINQKAAVICIILPALICGGMGLWALWKQGGTVEVWSMLLSIQLFVVMLAPASYIEIVGSERVTIGVALAACCCLPYFDALSGRKRWWLWTSSGLWLALIPVILLLTAL